MTLTEPILAALSLLQRQALLRHGAKQIASVEKRLQVDRELRRLGDQLTQLSPDALQSVTQAAAELGRPVEQLTLPEVLKCRRRYVSTVSVSLSARQLRRRAPDATAITSM